MLSKQCKAHLEEVAKQVYSIYLAVKLQLLVPNCHAGGGVFTQTGTTVMKDIIEKRSKMKLVELLDEDPKSLVPQRQKRRSPRRRLGSYNTRERIGKCGDLTGEGKPGVYSKP